MDQKVVVNVMNMELTDRITEYIEKKVPRLERLLPGIESLKFDLSFAKNARNRSDREISQITITGKGYVLRTEERDVDLFAAIDRSVDKMQRQIERFKGKRNRSRGDGTPASEVAPLPAEEETEPRSVIVRRKTFTLIPMDENEAIEQMALLAHEDFFIFYNVNTNSINILYRRRDGDYGLIDPKIG
jgi:putative sigma-54 modulation protein